MDPADWPHRKTAIVGVSLFVLISGAFLGAYLSGVGAGRADDPLSANGTLRFSDGDVYYPSNDTVRIVAAIGEDGKEYTTVSFETYSWWECRAVAHQRVHSELEGRYEGRDLETGTNGGVDIEASPDPTVHPNYYELKHSFPESVIVTLEYEGDTRTCQVPVFIKIDPRERVH